MKFAAFYMVTKDDFCLMESATLLKLQGIDRLVFAVPETYWNGAPVTTPEREQINHVALAVGAEIYPVAQPVYDFGTYAEKEAHFRNYVVDYITATGSEHVLIVDGDEIWREGTFEKLRSFVLKNRPRVVTVPSLSIIGFPGYPVASVQEGLLVYVQPFSRFVAGRSTSIHPLHLDMDSGGVIHFTSTRRTMEETIDKHRKSCHYDDEHYAFEWWIKHKLPKIKPGERDCHMFTEYQIWPRVREFTSKEWAEIPERLKKYLGRPAT